MIQWSMNDQILDVKLCKEPLNEIGLDLLEKFETLVDQIKQDHLKPRVIVFSSDISKGFCAGADLKSLYDYIKNKDQKQCAKDVRMFLDRIHGVFNFFDQIDCVTIGLIHGLCFGGGFELALTFDLLVATESARFGFPELRLGIIPGFGGLPRLKRAVGLHVVQDLLYTGRSINAQKAMDIGLVNFVVKEEQGLKTAMNLAKQVAKYDQGVIKDAKGFIKNIPLKEFEEEKDLFVQMFIKHNMEEKLKNFVQNKSVLPYVI